MTKPLSYYVEFTTDNDGVYSAIVKADKGVEVHLQSDEDGERVLYVNLLDGLEMSYLDDRLYGIFIRLDGEFWSLNALATHAEDILRDTSSEDKKESASWARQLS